MHNTEGHDIRGHRRRLENERRHRPRRVRGHGDANIQRVMDHTAGTPSHSQPRSPRGLAASTGGFDAAPTLKTAGSSAHTPCRLQTSFRDAQLSSSYASTRSLPPMSREEATQWPRIGSRVEPLRGTLERALAKTRQLLRHLAAHRLPLPQRLGQPPPGHGPQLQPGPPPRPGGPTTPHPSNADEVGKRPLTSPGASPHELKMMSTTLEKPGSSAPNPTDRRAATQPPRQHISTTSTAHGEHPTPGTRLPGPCKGLG